jgi:hypothetical protein
MVFTSYEPGLAGEIVTLSQCQLDTSLGGCPYHPILDIENFECMVAHADVFRFSEERGDGKTKFKDS